MSRPDGIYDIASDSKNNLYQFDIGSEYSVRWMPKTLNSYSLYRIPTFAV